MNRIRIGLAVVLLLGPLAAFAADPPAQSWSYDLWDHLMSPYCPGRTLLDCTSSQAAELRAWIAEQEKAGVSREDVEKELYKEFGDVILQAPRPTGFGLAAYVIPVLGLFAGGAIVAVFLRRQSARAPAPGPTVVLADPELDRLIDEEMKRG
jgi:cytochrome c-type biogenesis protein CcmH/NrfF